ncbi:protocatechuate 3,4-dioxygenase subunit alpha [Microbacterium hominis]|uniref:Protocatechuate 3,4-dioxygenase subunit alpha n=1 Tax=Microbacterium hominis TaxID=162426 RepID=A0A7D4TPY3_9MICO|nr:protocatechuate 3,4-dioxygenase subunit alpha [Microbacterium hominis]QKJ20782.1 protocatechuate 3,4-dioxygenase subunit alpha [Microbacterium hominis]
MTTANVPPKTHAPTAGQTVGPFFAYGVEYPKMREVAFPHSPGAIVLTGTVTDGDGNAIPDAMLEIWQRDADGSVPRGRGSLRRDDHTFTGFGRSYTNDEGGYYFWTRNPGQVAAEAPFIALIVYARGLPNKLHTRIYLPDDEAALAADPLLSSLDAEERATLIAERTPDGGLRFDVRLQGERETVFLAF